MNVLGPDEVGDALCKVNHDNLTTRRTAAPLHRACPLHLGMAVALMNEIGGTQ